MNNEFLKVWNNSHIKHFHGVIIYDDWLEKDPFNEIVKKNMKFMDLGCGQGNNTKYLLERGKNVISCDLSDEALNIVKRNILNSTVIQLDMTEKMPFDEKTFDVVISDLSLQYFSKKTTINVIKEIERILKSKGYLLLRLSSINDKNYGALLGNKIEEHYYFVEKRNKRYFDENDIRYFFKDWDIIYLKEKKSKLQRYEYERSYFEIIVRSKF